MQSQPDSSADEIRCEVTPWFYRRTLIAGGVLGALSAWFLIDGLFVYPKKLELYNQYQAYTLQHRLLNDSDESSQARGDWERFAKKNKSKGLQAEMGWAEAAEIYGWPKENPPPWKAYAEEKGYYAEPKKSDKIKSGDILEQFVYALIFGSVASLLGVHVFLNRRKVLSANREELLLPDGRAVPFAKMTKVDRQKWAKEGLAWITWKDEEREETAKLDCLKFETEGMEVIMGRILEVPSIEVVDQESTPEETEKTSSTETEAQSS